MCFGYDVVVVVAVAAVVVANEVFAVDIFWVEVILAAVVPVCTSCTSSLEVGKLDMEG